MQPGDRDEIARLIYHSTNAYYESIGRDRIFQGDELQPGEMFDVYERIDPSELAPLSLNDFWEKEENNDGDDSKA